ncbi:deoxyribonuclease-2-alpha-like [Melanotaenia boesemani]|uniref:deoxyribonuclease-2-alpha-like n=1 Tax=Melanotaenia boesemani TaxID=1250792 RepID=UPI001C05B9A0|nr:deoxyribonuclease-2-alpha-like [Melanotaenia boesemani]
MWRLLLTSCLLCWSCEGIRVSCKDESNHDVDWYIIYKGPAGLSYIFIDPSGQVTKKNNINSPTGALAYTLQPIFTPIRRMEQNFGFISYSDQPPGCQADFRQFGHSKGVLMVDKTRTGVWLLHSTPQFPYRRNENNFWPPSGLKKGQIFICATFKYNEFKNIGKHLQYIGAFPYEHDIPDSFHDELKHAVQWTKLTPPTSDFPTLTSDQGTTFKAIPKQQSNTEEDGDLYYTIAKDLKSDMLVQVWGN